MTARLKTAGASRLTMTITSAAIVFAATVGYGYQMAPSPLLDELREVFNLGGSNTLANLSISIAWPPVILAALATSWLISKIGIRNVGIASMLFMIAGCLSTLISPNYAVYLVGRVIYSFGFGLVVSFIGAAIMKWYSPAEREFMNTANGLFPFFGLTVCFNLTVPFFELLGSNLKQTFALWAVPVAVGLAGWLIAVRSDEIGYAATPEGKAEDAANEAALAAAGGEQNLYGKLLKRKEIICLCLIFIADFFCVQYLSTIMPAFFMGKANVSAGLSNTLVGLFFPIVGIAGAIAGGVIMTKSGLRRPILISSNMFKFAGIVVIVGGSLMPNLPVMVFGLALFAIGNSIWMPVLYCVITDLDDMNPARCAGAFALVCSLGYASGFTSTLAGGALTDFLAGISSQTGTAATMFGYTWSMALFSLFCFVGLVAAYKIRETGPGRK